MKVLLTGIAGFIGFHVAKALVARGDKVLGIDNINDYYDPQLKLARLKHLGVNYIDKQKGCIASDAYANLRFMQLDCADTAAMQQLFTYEKFDAVCHLAAQAGVAHSFRAPHDYVDANITGFLNILEGCRAHSIGHCVYASSSSVYGANRSYPYNTEQASTHPVSLYAATKRANELFAHSYSHNFALATTGLRFFTVYGPWGRPDMAPMLFLKNMLDDKPITVFNHGNMFRDFTFIDDIVKGVLLVIDKPAVRDLAWDAAQPRPDSSNVPFRIYNIGRGEPTKLTDFIDALEKVSGKKITRVFAPMRKGDVNTTHADTANLQRDFAYTPTVSLEQGVSKLWSWYSSYYTDNALSLGNIT